MIHLRDEVAADWTARESLLDTVFGAERVLKSSEAVRCGRLPAEGLALTAEDADGRFVGSVRLWHVDAGGVPALLLGPLAVDPITQGLGVGSALMRRALNRAGALGHGAVLLVGDPAYYARFGFSAALTARLLMPGPVERPRFQALELIEGHLRSAAGLIVGTGALAVEAPSLVSPEPAFLPAAA
ncbi:GNAT family N-acetyltransferase [Amorphus orientalis]|uniref:N-acetyltransferase YhbS n=1 Tax=Amorphus orientalis TaxID=649198 RepID=A0AAE4ARB7_9HYPH|nr:N-acetyltransferase [Amorphus orientalis]MDQ0313665.1 putative N-acetyltransferase YhbS [Amorphus orientalis]